MSDVYVLIKEFVANEPIVAAMVPFAVAKLVSLIGKGGSFRLNITVEGQRSKHEPSADPQNEKA